MVTLDNLLELDRALYATSRAGFRHEEADRGVWHGEGSIPESVRATIDQMGRALDPADDRTARTGAAGTKGIQVEGPRRMHVRPCDACRKASGSQRFANRRWFLPTQAI